MLVYRALKSSQFPSARLRTPTLCESEWSRPWTAFHLTLPAIGVRDLSTPPPSEDPDWNPWHDVAGPWAFDFTIRVNGASLADPKVTAEAAGVTLEPDSEEQSVTDVLGKVTSGEADAGLVYVTDVITAGDAVQGIELPESASVVNGYPIATVADSENADLAAEFVDLVLSDEGQQVLADAGFGHP